MPLDDLDGIAVIGLAGRFPGAATADQFWQNVRAGVEAVRFFTDDELRAVGIEEELLRNPTYVKARAVLENADLFDADFWGMNPREAAIMDPQHRLFLECAWEGLEYAGYNPEGCPGRVGVFAGVAMNTYMHVNLMANRALVEAVGFYQAMLGNDKDFLPTRVSYKLCLRGPSMAVQTACSSSLVAVHVACQSLLNGECDMVLAGGAAVRVPQVSGYMYNEGGIHSPDGHCRAYSAKGEGIVSGNGVGVVVLKRLADAVADGDSIYAVIKGSAINNDGAFKVGYTAPSVDGQAEVIAEAQAMAGFEPDSITYVEGHGTATPLGDPIEVAGLTKAFRGGTDRVGYCALGSVKTNIGHLDTAAGIAGLIKTVQALRHRELPPSLHYDQPNPKIDMAGSPFYVNTKLTPWEPEGPRRAGVSSFGIGGTNCHVVLEEAPALAAAPPTRHWNLLVLSARSEAALERATAELSAHLRSEGAPPLADAVYTLQVGRKAFDIRRIALVREGEDAAAVLEARNPRQVVTSVAVPDRHVAFLFPGQGSQYRQMGLGLYQHELLFREQVDCCAELLQPHLGLDLRTVLFNPDSEDQLTQTSLAQPALFVIEYALAQLWISWGIKPRAMVGHSIGEYVAACLAGVFTLEDALLLVAARGRLMQEAPGGSMLAVPLSEQEVEPLLGPSVSLAAVNAPSLCVLAGSTPAIAALEEQLVAGGLSARRLHTSHAFHSWMMEPLVDRFADTVRKVRLNPPQLPCLSNVTGTWLTAEQATDPVYWARQMRAPVRFRDCVQTLRNDAEVVFLEVGPGLSLGILVRQTLGKGAEGAVLASMRHPLEHGTEDQAMLMQTLGRLWASGVTVPWEQLYRNGERRRVALPTYPFERQRYWVDAAMPGNAFTREADAALAETAVATHARPALATAYMAPRNETEERIARMWEELLGVEQVGIHDNFFALGGHSLLATQLASRVRTAFAIEIPLARLFEASTVAGLAEIIAQTKPAQPNDDLLRQMLDEIKGLSEEELQQLLEAEQQLAKKVDADE